MLPSARNQLHWKRVLGDQKAAIGRKANLSAVRPRILVVDDEERLAMTIRFALRHSYEVEICTLGRDALRLLAERDFDVVLCDLYLPDQNAPDILREISRVAPQLVDRFVFLTGGSFTQHAQDFLRGVKNPRLYKPFDLEQLEAIIANQVAARAAQP